MTRPRTRDDIIAAAQQYFRASGVRAASMNEVASALGVPRSSLYYHFEERGDLVFELAHRALVEVTSKAAEIIGYPLSATQRLRILMRAIVRFSVESGSVPLSILVRDPGVVGVEKWEIIRGGRDDYERLFRRLLSEGVDAGEFAAIDTKLVVFAVLAMLEHIDVWFDPSGPQSCEEVADIYSALVLRGISVETSGPPEVR